MYKLHNCSIITITVMDIQDECPLVLCYSSNSGTGLILDFCEIIVICISLCIGKSTSLRNSLSLFGAHLTNINGPDTPTAAIVSQTSTTTVPIGEILQFCRKFTDNSPYNYNKYGIDDIRSCKKLEAIAVQLFNGFSHTTLARGLQQPRTSLIVTANQPFCDQERYTLVLYM